MASPIYPRAPLLLPKKTTHLRAPTHYCCAGCTPTRQAETSRDLASTMAPNVSTDADSNKKFDETSRIPTILRPHCCCGKATGRS